MKNRCRQRTYTQPAEIEKIDAPMMPINFGITWQKTPKLSVAALFRAVSRCFEVGGGSWLLPCQGWAMRQREALLASWQRDHSSLRYIQAHQSRQPD